MYPSVVAQMRQYTLTVIGKGWRSLAWRHPFGTAVDTLRQPSSGQESYHYGTDHGRANFRALGVPGRPSYREQHMQDTGRDFDAAASVASPTPLCPFKSTRFTCQAMLCTNVRNARHEGSVNASSRGHAHFVRPHACTCSRTAQNSMSMAIRHIGAGFLLGSRGRRGPSCVSADRSRRSSNSHSTRVAHAGHQYRFRR